MRQDGRTLQEIADELGLSHKQLKNWSYRHNCENRNIRKGAVPKPKGRPRKDGQAPRQDVQKELERLRMENKLVRPRIKYAIIYLHQSEYPVSAMCKFFNHERIQNKTGVAPLTLRHSA